MKKKINNCPECKQREEDDAEWMRPATRWDCIKGAAWLAFLVSFTGFAIYGFVKAIT